MEPRLYVKDLGKNPVRWGHHHRGRQIQAGWEKFATCDK